MPTPPSCEESASANVTRRKRNNVEAAEPVIGLMTIELHSPHSHSLKEKRMVVKAIKDRLRGRFNVAVAETGYQDLWQRAVLSAVTVGSETGPLEGVMEAMARDVEERHPSEVVHIHYEILG